MDNLIRLMDKFIKDLWNGGLYYVTILIAIGVSIAISAISYGIQALLAPKPPPIYGPRLDDLGPSTTNTGRPIPKATGRNIVNGQVIWSTGLVETKNVEEVGGKGGGSATKVKTYTYSASVAIAVNDGEICGFNRILGNGAKTIWAQNLGANLTDVQIDELVEARYAEVYAEQLAIWLAVIDPVTGLPKYSANEADALANTEAIDGKALRIYTGTLTDTVGDPFAGTPPGAYSNNPMRVGLASLNSARRLLVKPHALAKSSIISSVTPAPL